MIGARLGPYEVLAKLGEGGMGEVYRARDTRLNRDVALKVLPDAFAAEPDRLARFEREAQLLAALNHPHIAAIYGFEEGPVVGPPEGGPLASEMGTRFSRPVRALVLELVEGPTLADRIAQGPLPLDDALTIADQIAQALEAAHDKGVIHRDLKPANIKLTRDGRVKVLDFGLAKLRDPNASSSVSLSPTMTSPAMLTGVGMMLGTAAYMSPEQAKGRPADARSDMWAFGCVLFEMLTGRTVFAGDSVGEIVSEVIKSEPDWARLPPDTPASVRRLLRRCLAKDPERRLRDAGDARLDLGDTASEPAVAVVHDRRARRYAGVAVAAIALVAAGLAAGLVWSREPDAASGRPKRFHLAAPADAEDIRSLQFSPAGTELAIAGRAEGRGAIWIRPLESVEARRVAGNLDRPSHLFWSPDGRQLGLFDGGQLKILNLATGEVRIVAEARDGQGGTWGADDTILFTPDAIGGVHRVSARGGPVTPVTSPDPAKGEQSHRWPQLLPDGRHFIFMGWSSSTTAGATRFTIQVAAVDAPGATVLATSGSRAVYDPAGYLLFVVQTPARLVALPFDADTRAVTGTPVTVAQDAAYEWVGGELPLTSAADGTLAYLNGRHEFTQPTWYDRAGRTLGTAGEPGRYYDPALSPDGRSVVLEKTDENTGSGDLWKVDVATGTYSRLTHEPTFDNVPVWSPDGRRLLFSSDADNLSHLYLMASDGAGARTPLFAPPGSLAFAMDWSRDGASALVMVADEQRNRDLWVVPMAGGDAPKPVVQSRYEERGGSFSPDGRAIAYVSNESGRPQVYVRAWPSLTGIQQVSSGGGFQPLWRGDGRELFFGTLEGTILAAPVTPRADRLEVGSPAPLFSPGMDPAGGIRNAFVVTSDGQRFLVLTPLVDPVSSRISFFVNWPALVQRGR